MSVGGRVAAEQARAELDETEVADEPVLVATEPVEADDPGRPGPERRAPRRSGVTATAVGTPCSRSRSSVAARAGRARTPCARRARARPARRGSGRERRTLRRKEKPGVLARARAQEPRLDPAGLARRDQLSAERAQERVRDRRRAERAQAAQAQRRVADQRIRAESPQELRVVGVDGEHEAQALEGRLRLGAVEPHPERPVPDLPHACERGAAVGLEDAGEEAVAKDARTIAGSARRQLERVGAAGADGRLERHPGTVAPPPD